VVQRPYYQKPDGFSSETLFTNKLIKHKTVLNHYFSLRLKATMIFQKSPLALCVALATTILPQQVFAQDCSSTWTCAPTSAPPTIDSDLSEWADVEGISTPIIAITGQEYEAGNAVYKCMYDGTHIFFALDIPGDYRFNATDNTQCASIATMLKIGSSATFLNMGGCPDAISGCEDGVPDTCMDYRVDVGAHWELRGTEQAVTYPISVVADAAVDTRSGNDLLANKDDEYAVSSFCRFDDDGADAGNEWAGAWRVRQLHLRAFSSSQD
jgi:hypothetical protein